MEKDKISIEDESDPASQQNRPAVFTPPSKAYVQKTIAYRQEKKRRTNVLDMKSDVNIPKKKQNPITLDFSAPAHYIQSNACGLMPGIRKPGGFTTQTVSEAGSSAASEPMAWANPFKNDVEFAYANEPLCPANEPKTKKQIPITLDFSDPGHSLHAHDCGLVPSIRKSGSSPTHDVSEAGMLTASDPTAWAKTLNNVGFTYANGPSCLLNERKIKKQTKIASKRTSPASCLVSAYKHSSRMQPYVACFETAVHQEHVSLVNSSAPQLEPCCCTPSICSGHVDVSGSSQPESLASNNGGCVELPNCGLVDVGCGTSDRARKLKSWKEKRALRITTDQHLSETSHVQCSRKTTLTTKTKKKVCREFLVDIVEKSDVLGIVPNCSYCSAKKFPHETDNFCCSGGDVVLASNKLPKVLVDLLTNQDTESTNFRTSIRTYNNHFAFTSLGATYDKDLARCNKGIYTFRVQGQVYHFMNDLVGTSDECANLQFYFHDTEYEKTNRLLRCPRLFEMTVDKILTVLDQNPYARFFRDLSATPNLEELDIVLFCNPTIDQRVYNKPTVPQVAGIISNSQESQQRSIKVYARSGQSHNIQYYYACFDPLQYPIIFTDGQLGWHQGIRKQGVKQTRRKRKRMDENCFMLDPKNAETAHDLLQAEDATLNSSMDDPDYISIREYYCYRFQIRESDESYLLHFGRLFQQYAVDMFVKLETQRLDYFRAQQRNIRQEFMQGIVDAVGSGEIEAANVGQRMILPAAFTGGPRHMKKKYLDAMALVRKYGKPDIFLTITCNPNWPEVKECLKHGELAQDRPDLLDRVFRAKLEELKLELFKKNVFGKIAAYTYVIEFQKRGMPHAHFLLILKPHYKIYRPEEFDKIVCAQLPDKRAHPHLYRLVVQHMMHGPCGSLNPKNVCMRKDGSCRSSYPKDFCEETHATSDTYPTYKRPNDGVKAKVRGCFLDNRWVIPYNPYLLAKFNCHINVEICSTVKAVKYIYKYICKGNDKIMFAVTDKESSESLNEIDQYQSGRWVSPPEALWRIYKFPLGDMRPAVIQLQVHLENFQPISFNQNHKLKNVMNNPFNRKTMLTEYFVMNRTDRTAQERQCTYGDFPDFFVWETGKKRWKQRMQGDSIGRIVAVNPIEGERYYLKLLLSKVKCPTSFMDLKTFSNTTYSTFHESALARGLLEQNNSQEQCLTEAALYRMPCELRRLFATILVYSCPSDPLSLWKRFEMELSEDVARQTHLSKREIQKNVLRQINAFLQSMGKDLGSYGLIPPSMDSEIFKDPTKELRSEQNIVVCENDLNSRMLLNKEQQVAFDEVTAAVYNNESECFFIDGPGGTGKTYLYRALLADVRSKGYIALATATSGIAASLLPGGRTAHSRFKIPIDVTDEPTCKISKQSSLADLIKESKLILWDEAPMSKKTAIEALDLLLQDLMGNDKLFGGKVVVLGGDFRQTLPVVQKGTKSETINASLIKSHLWTQLKKINLVQNMRARLDPAFTSFLLDIGQGLNQDSDVATIKLPTHIIMPCVAGTSGLDNLISLVFSETHHVDGDTHCSINRAILTTKNLFVDDINNMMIKTFPGEETEYVSFDKTLNSSDQGQYEDIINNLSPNGLPPHKLILKPNAPIILLRNLDPSEGLCNGTRMICKQLDKNVLHAEIAVGDHAGKDVFIHRIPLQPSKDEFYPVPYKRIQFPVKLCFAMTINKAQGQTLDFVGIYLKEPVFSHGQLYVALSRARTSKALKVLIEVSEDDGIQNNFTKNVVYKEVLTNNA